jgi:hypothetical protein
VTPALVNPYFQILNINHRIPELSQMGFLLFGSALWKPNSGGQYSFWEYSRGAVQKRTSKVVVGPMVLNHRDG